MDLDLIEETSPMNKAHGGDFRVPYFNILPSPYRPDTDAAGIKSYGVYNRLYMPETYGHNLREQWAKLAEEVVMWDVAHQRVYELKGPDAVRLADYICTKKIEGIQSGRALHTSICAPDGEILCEAIVLQPEEGVIWIGHGPCDFEFWARSAAYHKGFDVELGYVPIHQIAVQGPLSAQVVSRLVPGIETLAPFRWTKGEIAGYPVLVTRSGWSGELGYEVWPLQENGCREIWAAIQEAGRPESIMVTPVNIVRSQENGLTDIVYGLDLGVNPYEMHIGRVVSLDKGEFIGREALQRIHDQGPARRHVGLLLDGEEFPPFFDRWPLTDSEGDAGVLWRINYSFALERFIADGIVPARVEYGSKVEVNLPGGGTAEAQVVKLPMLEHGRT